MKSLLMETFLAAFLTALSLAAVPFTMTFFMLSREKEPLRITSGDSSSGE